MENISSTRFKDSQGLLSTSGILIWISMFLFKTSGETFQNVIENQKHAYTGEPKNWNVGEIVLVSKNKRESLNWRKTNSIYNENSKYKENKAGRSS